MDELGDALRAEFALELARKTPPPKATGEASTATEPVRVQNDRTEKVHLVAVGADSGLPAKRWKSFCGWEFGRWGGYTFVVVVVGGHKPLPANGALTTAQPKTGRRAGMAGPAHMAGPPARFSATHFCI